MAISILINRSGPYTTDGIVTNFAYAFEIAEDSDLRVFQRTTATGAVAELTLNVDYTVTGAGDATGGNVVISPAVASGYTILILRSLPQDQETNLSNQGGWFPEVHEAVFDYLTMLCQDLSEKIDRCIKIGETEASFTDELTGTRATYALGFDSSGNPTLFASTDVALSGTIGSRAGTTGTNSLVNGTNVEASGSDSRGSGTNAAATGDDSDATGDGTLASGAAAHAEGKDTTASGDYAHSEGQDGTASGDYAHVEGKSTTASDLGAHAEGTGGAASGQAAHKEGANGTASGNASHVEGTGCQATQDDAHAEGANCIASGANAHAEGSSCTASGQGSHAEGTQCTASGHGAHAQGYQAVAALLNEDVLAGGRFAANGDCQVRRYVMRGATTDATPLALVLPEDFTVDDEHSVELFIKVHGRQDTGGAHYSNFLTATFGRTGGTLTIVGAAEELMTPLNAGVWGGVAVAADGTNTYPEITVTGKAGTNIRWCAYIEAVQIGYSD